MLETCASETAPVAYLIRSVHEDTGRKKSQFTGGFEMQRSCRIRLRVRRCSREDPRLKEAYGYTREADEGAMGLKENITLRSWRALE